MSVSVRQAENADVDHLVPLFNGYRQFYGQPDNPVRARDFLAERLSCEEAVVFFAEIDGEAAGFSLLYPMFSSVQTARVWVLNDLFVSPARRHRGVARALLSRCEAFGVETGAYALQLQTQRTNTVAQALYMEQGWEPDEEFCNYQLLLQARG